MRRFASAVALLSAGAGAGLAAGVAWAAAHAPDALSPSSFHTGPQIERLRDLASLATLRVDVADVQETTVGGFAGGMKVAVLTKGDFLVATDLSRARVADVDAAGRRAVVVLPRPEVLSPRLDHDRTRLFGVTRLGLWRLVPGRADETRLVNAAFADAQRAVAAAATDPALTDRARRQAEQVVVGFYRALGWEVRVRWED